MKLPPYFEKGEIYVTNQSFHKEAILSLMRVLEFLGLT